MTLPSKAAMEIARQIVPPMSQWANKDHREERVVEIASLIDAHPQVKGLLQAATDYTRHTGGEGRHHCPECAAIYNWQPQPEKED